MWNMFKVNNKDVIVTVNFEYISQLFPVFLLLTLNMQMLAGYNGLWRTIALNNEWSFFLGDKSQKYFRN